MKVLAAAALLACVSVPAMATSVLDVSFGGPLNVDLAKGYLGTDTSFAITPFDAKLGTLTGVIFTFQATFDATFDYSAPSKQSFNVALSYATPVTLANYQLKSASGGSAVFPDAFGQVIGDYDFTANVTNSKKGSIEFTNDVGYFGSDFNPDQKAYTDSSLAFHFDYFPQASVTGLDPSNYKWSIANTGSGKVQYLYDPITSAAPEPASWAPLLGGFGLIGGITRAARRSDERFTRKVRELASG